MVGIIDYGVGNLFSLKSSLAYIGEEAVVTNDPAVLQLSLIHIFYTWQKVDEDHTSVRFCTSWATDAENVEQLLADIRAFGA